jgi:hypothetical protein
MEIPAKGTQRSSGRQLWLFLIILFFSPANRRLDRLLCFDGSGGADRFGVESSVSDET